MQKRNNGLSNQQKKQQNRQGFVFRKRQATSVVARFTTAQPFPPKWPCALRYSQHFSLSSGSGGVMGTEQVFRLNSLFDPDFSGGGHQPQGFDQLTPIYGRYLITHAEIELTFSNANADGLYISSILQPSSATYTLTGKDPYAVDELQVTTNRYLNATGSQVTRIKFGKIPLHKLEGVSNMQYFTQIGAYGADVTTTPAASPYVRVAVGSLTGTSGDNCQVMARLVFHGEFYDRKMQAVS